MESSELPFVSVLMPIRNETAYIETSLKAVIAQDYPSEQMEIIISDGMSTDGTREIVQSFQAQCRNLHLINNPGRIAPTGLNAAFAHAKGEIISRIDGHCEIAPDYIRKCVEYIQNDQVDGIGGPMKTIGETDLARVIALAMSSPFGVGFSAFRTIQGKTMLVDTIPFPTYTRAIMERAGPYDEELVRNQDDEYNYRLRKLGAKLLMAADIQSRYYSRTSLISLWRQYLQYGFWKVRVMQKHPRQMRPRQFVPPAFAASLVGSAALALFFPGGWTILALVAGLYLLGNLAASIYVASHNSWRYLALLPVVYAILHLSYGLGFLAGLVRFAGRWGDKTQKPSKYQSANA